MRIFARLALFLILPAVMGLRPLVETEVTIEVRRAETEPAAGLTEANVVGRDDKIYLHATPDLVNADFESARVVPARTKGRFGVAVTLTDEGARKAAQMSKEHLKKPVAIMINEKVIMAPRLVSEIGKRFEITGGFTEDEAARIAGALNDRSLR